MLDREDTSDQKLTKTERTIEPTREHTGSERRRNPSQKDRLKKDEDSIVFDRDALMDKSNDY